MPLEKYKQDGSEKKKDSSDISGMTELQREGLKRELEELRTGLKEGYLKKKKEVIKKTLEIAKGKDANDDIEDDYSPADTKKLERKWKRERRKEFKQVFAESGNAEFRKYAFSEVNDFSFNKEAMKGEGGWLEEYKSTEAKNKFSLEDFVLSKRYEQINQIRETMTETRIRAKITDLYTELDGDDKKKDRNKKVTETTKAANKFFGDNAFAIETYIQAKGAEKDNLKKDLFKTFSEDVFADIDLKDPAKKQLVEGLFEDMVGDYQAMLISMEQAKALNPKMVQLMMQDGLTEEQWEKELADEAERITKRILEEEKKQQLDVLVKSGTKADVSPENNYFSGPISSAEVLGKESEVSFKQVGPGEYRVVFPISSGKQESTFYARKVKENGIEKVVFVFNDPVLDKATIVDEKAFRSQINGLYLDRMMSDDLKKGADYLGPALNDVLHDQEMYVLAEKLFYPRKLAETTLLPADVEIFKKLLIVTTSKSNNEKGEGIYGNMLPINNRFKLWNFVMSLESGQKASMVVNFLRDKSPELLKTYSVERVVKELGIKPNYGNY